VRGPVPWLKPALFTGCLMPLASILLRAARGALGANPIAEAMNELGLLALTFLLTTLAMTPLRVLFGWTWPIRIRRMLGLFAFFYAACHFTTYLAIDQLFNLKAIGADIVKRKFIFVGFAAFVLLIPLAITSTNGMVRRLGIERWQRLHQLAYVAPVLGVIHFIWRVKKDLTQPETYAVILSILLAFRIVNALRLRAKKRGGPVHRTKTPRRLPSDVPASRA
jgi:methionine sulfoxide reductase heme-binding subunit